MPFTLNPPFQSPKSKQSPSKKGTPPTPYQTLNTSRAQKTLTPQYLQKKFQELYLENQRWTDKKLKIRQDHAITKEQKQLKECTFQPTLNPQLSFNGSNPSPFLKREMDWVSKKEKRIQQLVRQTQKKVKKQCSFKPKISSKSYAILSNAFKTSRTMVEPTQRNNLNKTFVGKRNSGCYRQIHMRQQGYKELQKTNSIHQFTLMTERRFVKRMGLWEYNDEMNLDTDRNNEVRSFKISGGEDYIENIVIKTEEQNTFDSLTSLDLKTARKYQDNQVKQDKNQEGEKQGDDNEGVEQRDEHYVDEDIGKSEQAQQQSREDGDETLMQGKE